MDSYKLTAAEYIEHMRTAPVACVDLVLFNALRDQVLLLRRTNEPVKGVYFTPGGCIQKGETFFEAVSRKAQQELDLTLVTDKLKGPYVIEELWPNSAFPNVSYHSITIFFEYILSESEANGIALDTQHNNLHWFSVDDPNIHPNVQQRIFACTKK